MIGGIVFAPTCQVSLRQALCRALPTLDLCLGAEGFTRFDKP
jgi:hypothetical protein